MKSFLPFFLLFILLASPGTAANYSEINNGFFIVRMDRITGGFHILSGKEPFISSGYPASSFALLSLDNREYALFQQARLLSMKESRGSLSALFFLDGIEVTQTVSFEESACLISYRIKNTLSQSRVLGLALVLDIVPGVENHFIDKGLMELKLAGFSQPFAFEAGDASSGMMKLGDYQGFKTDFTRSRGRTDKVYNALALYALPQKIGPAGGLTLSFEISRLEEAHAAPEIRIDADDLDFFTDELLKPVKAATNAKRPVPSFSAPTNRMPAVTRQSNKPAAVQPATNQTKPVKRRKDPYEFELLDDFIDESSGSMNKGAGK